MFQEVEVWPLEGREGGEQSRSGPSANAPPRPPPCAQVLEYNAVGGKYQRGLTVSIAYRQLVEPGKQDADGLRRALTVGWCVELVRGWGGGAEVLPGRGHPGGRGGMSRKLVSPRVSVRH